MGNPKGYPHKKSQGYPNGTQAHVWEISANQDPRLRWTPIEQMIPIGSGSGYSQIRIPYRSQGIKQGDNEGPRREGPACCRSFTIAREIQDVLHHCAQTRRRSIRERSPHVAHESHGQIQPANWLNRDMALSIAKSGYHTVAKA